MKAGLQAGQRFEFAALVTDAMKAQFEDGVVHALYSTASMLVHMEWAARQHILPYLEAHEEGVGYQVELRHINPTPIGATVRVASVVTDVQPNRVTSAVSVFRTDTPTPVKIGEGVIVQAIVPRAQLTEAAPSAEQPLAQPDLLQPDKDDNEEKSENEDARPETPPPAVLASTDGNARFSFEVLAWETLLPCTRYDEWLICRSTLETGAEQMTQEGPYLLRYEILEWIEALEKLGTGEHGHYRSDFLEPRLFWETTRAGAQNFSQTLRLSAHHQPGKPPERAPLETRFTVSVEALREFTARLQAQMTGFEGEH